MRGVVICTDRHLLSPHAFAPVCEAVKVTSRVVSAKSKKRPPKPGQDRRRNPRAQRATVKVLSKFHGGKSGSGLARHTGYLTRDSASKDGERGTFFGAQQEQVDGRTVTKEWEGDRHHFLLILSPEKGYDIADMRAYVRDVMQRVERDVGTKLDWIGIEHHNTDNPHAHILFRGKDDQGQDLILRREYIGYGIRQRAPDPLLARLWWTRPGNR